MTVKEHKNIDLFYKKRDLEFNMILSNFIFSFEKESSSSVAVDIQKSYVSGKISDYENDKNKSSKRKFVDRKLVFFIYVFYLYVRFLVASFFGSYLEIIFVFVILFGFFSGLFFNICL